MRWLIIKILLVKLMLYEMFGRDYVASVCGHKTKLFARLDIFGQTFFLTVKSKPKYCSKCSARMSIKCAWCGEPILIGYPITLCTPIERYFPIPNYAVVYKTEPLQLVGCSRQDCAGQDCARSETDRAGFWIEPGMVYRGCL